jgi:hypothetical protein
MLIALEHVSYVWVAPNFMFITVSLKLWNPEVKPVERYL